MLNRKNEAVLINQNTKGSIPLRATKEKLKASVS